MIYCPKYKTWIHRGECDLEDACWDLEDWDSCVILKSQVERVSIEEIENEE